MPQRQTDFQKLERQHPKEDKLFLKKTNVESVLVFLSIKVSRVTLKTTIVKLTKSVNCWVTTLVGAGIYLSISRPLAKITVSVQSVREPKKFVHSI